MTGASTISRPQVDKQQAEQDGLAIARIVAKHVHESPDCRVWSALATLSQVDQGAKFARDMVQAGDTPLRVFIDQALRASNDPEASQLRQRYQEAQGQIADAITIGQAQTGGNGQQLLRQHDTSRVGDGHQG